MHYQLHLMSAVLLLCTRTGSVGSSTALATPQLPVLSYPDPPPREWLNVQTGCSLGAGGADGAGGAGGAGGAKGDGKTDDTAAIQACLNMINNETKHYAVYLPVGTYKITSTLKLFRVLVRDLATTTYCTTLDAIALH